MGLFSFLSNKSAAAASPQSATTSRPDPLAGLSKRDIELRTGNLVVVNRPGMWGQTEALHRLSEKLLRQMYTATSHQFAHIKDPKEQEVAVRDAIDKAVWLPLTGKTLQDNIKTAFIREGIHCHSPQALQRESEYYVYAVMAGDFSRFSQFLTYQVKTDLDFIQKLEGQVYARGFDRERMPGRHSTNELN